MAKANCIHFRGDTPCTFNIICEKCLHFEPFPQKILIIKGWAQGDVLRTTSLLPGLKRKYPRSFTSWLVARESADLLRHNPYLDQIIVFDLESLLPLLVEKFDILISLDKEACSTSLATKLNCPQKFGFGMNEYGNLSIFNKASEYAYRLGIDNDLKFRQNKKTYQEMIYEIAEIDYRKDEYVFELKEEERKKAQEFFKKNKIPKKKLNIGLNTGAGTRFETKQWPQDRFLKLISFLKKLGVNIFLLGGKKEKELNKTLEKRSKNSVYNTGSDNSTLEFAGFISMMDLVVSSDSLAMHLAIALKKKTIALFGPTCPQEIDLYGRGAKIFAGLDCSPCYRQICPKRKCMRAISAEKVFQEIKKLI